MKNGLTLSSYFTEVSFALIPNSSFSNFDFDEMCSGFYEMLVETLNYLASFSNLYVSVTFPVFDRTCQGGYSYRRYVVARQGR